MSCAVKFQDLGQSALAGSSYTTGKFDTSGRKALSLQATVAGTISAGTVQLQHSNDGTNWGNNGTATAVSGAGTTFISVSDFTYDFARAIVAATTGNASSINILMVAKS